jgi:hypothetical protein
MTNRQGKTGMNRIATSPCSKPFQPRHRESRYAEFLRNIAANTMFLEMLNGNSVVGVQY